MFKTLMFFFAVYLLSEIIFDPDLSNHVQLRFEEIDVMLLICQYFDE